jgi:hypothetical protein
MAWITKAVQLTSKMESTLASAIHKGRALGTATHNSGDDVS